MIVPFVVQIFAVVGLTGWLSLRNGQQAVNDVASQLRQEVTSRIEDQVDLYLETAHLSNRLIIDAITLELPPVEDMRSLEKLSGKLLRRFGSLTYTGFGNEKGEYVVHERITGGVFWIEETVGVEDIAIGRIKRYLADEQGKKGELLQATEGFDPRKRPWYTKAVELGRAGWSDVYVWFSENSLCFDAIEPVYDAEGNLLGVTDTGFTLSQISELLSNLKIGKSGKTFIVERSGLLIATSTLEPLFIVNNNVSERVSALNSQDPLTQAAAKFLSEKFSNFNQIIQIQQFDFSFNGQKQFLQISPLKDERGLDWLTVVVVPESDFMEQINANTRTTILLCIGALGVAILSGLVTSRWISGLILKLNHASQAIAQGNLEQTVNVTGIQELESLAKSFTNMAGQLRASFTALEQTNSLLEERVERRTAELKVANQQILTLNEQLKADNSRMGAELEVTRRLQQLILPKEEELQLIDDLEIAGFMEPASEVGGDYYDVLQQNGRLKIGIGDVTGHGLESGVLMIMVQMAVRTLLASDETDPSRFLNIVNQAIYNNVQRMNSDKNMTLALLDYQKGLLSLTGQHEEMILIRQNGTIERIDTVDLGFPIGLESEISSFIGKAEVRLESGDVVILYTDGITEAENPQGQQYGLHRLCQVAQPLRDRSASDIRQAIVEDIRQFIGQQRVYDDITLLVMKQR